MLTTAFLTDLKNYIKANAGYARVTANGTNYDIPLASAEVDGTGRVIISFVIDSTLPTAITVTKVQVYNKQNVLWADKTESITRTRVEEGIYYRIALTITEV